MCARYSLDCARALEMRSSRGVLSMTFLFFAGRTVCVCAGFFPFLLLVYDCCCCRRSFSSYHILIVFLFFFHSLRECMFAIFRRVRFTFDPQVHSHMHFHLIFANSCLQIINNLIGKHCTDSSSFFICARFIRRLRFILCCCCCCCRRLFFRVQQQYHFLFATDRRAVKCYLILFLESDSLSSAQFLFIQEHTTSESLPLYVSRPVRRRGRETDDRDRDRESHMSNEMHVNGEITILFAEKKGNKVPIYYTCVVFFFS